MKNLSNKKKFENGQTLIETLVAIFMLITGITASLGLAIYAFGQSTGVVKQIVAEGLAREGIEAVKNMRDINWLRQTTINSDCYNYVSQAFDSNCYKDWMGNAGTGYFCLDPTDNSGNCNGNGATTQEYFLGTKGSDSDFWVLKRQRNCGSNCNYGLLLDLTNSGGRGIYNTQTDNGVTCSNGAGKSDFCRRIVITEISTRPYDKTNSQGPGPMLEVKSQVWWTDKKCPRSATWPGLGTCSLELTSYLTNWKDYQ
jgi:hypothetical protein